MTKKKLSPPQQEKVPRSSDRLLELAKLYWRHLLTTVLISLVVWSFAIFSPRLGIAVPTLFFMPTLFTIVLAFVRDPARDRAQAFSFSVLTGFVFFVLVTVLAPLFYSLLYPEGG